MKNSDHDEIERIEREGHTYHCACRQVWGDGECECKKKGIVPGPVSVEVMKAAGLPYDHYASIIHCRDAATAAHILADLCRKKDEEITRLNGLNRLNDSNGEEERVP